MSTPMSVAPTSHPRGFVKTVFMFGAPAGLLVISSMILGIVTGGLESFTASQAFGYLLMLVALSLIFIGVKQYRDRDLGGVIRFGRAFALGAAMAAVAGLVYVVVWEIYLVQTDFAFIHDYTQSLLAKSEAGAMSPQALAEQAAKMEDYRANYMNPFYRLPITFLEIFPIGLIVALVTAAILRNPAILPAKR